MIDLPSSDHDHLQLSHRFMELQQDVLRSNELERRENSGETLTADEHAFLAGIPEKMREACDITRILRRTNTGPARIKEPKRSSKKALAQEEINKLMDM